MREDQCAVVPFGLDPCERSAEESDLRVADVLIRDHARVFQHVAVDREDADERRLEGIEHTRLDLRRARQAAGIGCHQKRLGAKVPEKGIETGDVDVWYHHAIVIARDRQDRSGVIPIGVVELIVIILRFAKAVDYVAEQQVELRLLLGVGFVKVADQFVGNLVCFSGLPVLPQSPTA